MTRTFLYREVPPFARKWKTFVCTTYIQVWTKNFSFLSGVNVKYKMRKWKKYTIGDIQLNNIYLSLNKVPDGQLASLTWSRSLDLALLCRAGIVWYIALLNTNWLLFSFVTCVTFCVTLFVTIDSTVTTLEMSFKFFIAAAATSVGFFIRLKLSSTLSSPSFQSSRSIHFFNPLQRSLWTLLEKDKRSFLSLKLF